MLKSIDNADHYKWGNNCDGWHLLKSEKLTVIQERMPGNTSETLHFHNTTQQVFYILSGFATFEFNESEMIAVAGESLHIPARTLHRISNREQNDLTFLVISEPDSHSDRIEIIEYSDDLKDSIKILNYEWLEKYFRIEPGDVVSLSNPKTEIIDKGGLIFYARMNNEIIGTASLLKKSEEVFELGKMAVTDNAQGLGIGNILVNHCLNIAKQKNIKKLVLYSNTGLESAIHLYRKFGFTEIELEKGLYERANIKMEKYI